jgi:hypothetical protein
MFFIAYQKKTNYNLLKNIAGYRGLNLLKNIAGYRGLKKSLKPLW